MSQKDCTVYTYNCDIGLTYYTCSSPMYVVFATFSRVFILYAQTV